MLVEPPVVIPLTSTKSLLLRMVSKAGKSLEMVRSLPSTPNRRNGSLQVK